MLSLLFVNIFFVIGGKGILLFKLIRLLDVRLRWYEVL